MGKRKSECTKEEWAKIVANSSYNRAKREREALAKLKPKRTGTGTRLIKCQCVNPSCGMIFRATRSWLNCPLQCPRCYAKVEVSQ